MKENWTLVHYGDLCQKGEEEMCVELMMRDWRGGGSVGDMAEDLGI